MKKAVLSILLFGSLSVSAKENEHVIRYNKRDAGLSTLNKSLVEVSSQVVDTRNTKRFHVELPNDDTKLFDVRVFDVLGREVYQGFIPKNTQHRLDFDIAYFPKGTYILKVYKTGPTQLASSK